MDTFYETLYASHDITSCIQKMSPNAHLTTPIVWYCTGILAVLDVFLALLARRVVSREQLGSMRRVLTFASGIFFLLVWTSAMLWAWDWFYIYIFPSWARVVLPLLFCLGYALFAWGMAWLSLRLPGHPAVTWCLLGGVEGLLSHMLAIYALGAASKPPIMQGTDPFAVLIFAIFEKGFYWSLILIASRYISLRLYPKSG